MKVIKLTTGHETVVDDCDFEYLTKVFATWRAQPVRDLLYAVTAKTKPDGTRTTLRMHRLIMESIAGPIPKPYVVDHINRDGLCNLRSNLRICTQSKNMQNQNSVRLGSSFYKGVVKRQNGSFYARITINGKLTHIGSFRNELDAARAYNEAALKYFGEYANLNVIPNGT